jgi:glutathione peroxidase
MINLIGWTAVAAVCGAALAAEPTTGPSTQPSVANPSTPPPLAFTMKSLSGQDVDLRQYLGKVVLIVNTASKCGNTPQYAPLETLYKTYQDRGFVILGFPSNDFHHQEPGTDKDISEFCTKNYGVTFPMFSKVDVKGDGMCDLYKFLTSEDTDKPFAGAITWNFEKFLIGRDGTVVARFRPKVKPDAPEVVATIEGELAK